MHLDAHLLGRVGTLWNCCSDGLWFDYCSFEYCRYPNILLEGSMLSGEERANAQSVLRFIMAHTTMLYLPFAI